MAATWGRTGRSGPGRMPLAQSARTLPGVSFPSSVVRSIMRMASSSAQTLDAFLMERFRRALGALGDADLVHAADALDERPERARPTDPGTHEGHRARLRSLARIQRLDRRAFDDLAHDRDATPASVASRREREGAGEGLPSCRMPSVISSDVAVRRQAQRLRGGVPLVPLSRTRSRLPRSLAARLPLGASSPRSASSRLAPTCPDRTS